MNDQQQQSLASLRLKYQDGDSRFLINEFERNLLLLIEQKGMIDHPVFKMIVQDAQKRIDEINTLLMNDRALTDMQRSNLFHEKDVWSFNLSRFGLTGVDKALTALEDRINFELNK
jgi:hypothetical protein